MYNALQEERVVKDHTVVEVLLHQSENGWVWSFCNYIISGGFGIPALGEDAAAPARLRPALCYQQMAHGPTAWGLWREQRKADFLGVCFCFPKQKSDSDFSSRSCNSANNNTLLVEVIKASIFVLFAELIKALTNLSTPGSTR